MLIHGLLSKRNLDASAAMMLEFQQKTSLQLQVFPPNFCFGVFAFKMSILEFFEFGNFGGCRILRQSRKFIQ